MLAVAGVAATSFRSSRGIDAGGAAGESAGAALCLQVACYCDNRQDSLYGRLNDLARTADTTSEIGLQSLVSDACLVMLLFGLTDGIAQIEATLCSDWHCVLGAWTS